MTKNQRKEAIAFMYAAKVELICAPYGVYDLSSCQLCCFNNCGVCPVDLAGELLCRSVALSGFKTFFRQIPQS